ncbi:hypothetical protein GGX14DRAFT_395828 [Mycena pura]|uniref:Uncharacterized protein n=1 Tax=Mycena pura TaxID=153505 RepID=A0AAD6YCB3_9AGAR|nr:hypothetical protein GGX14DRAFT_395828 [Mycena pura]
MVKGQFTKLQSAHIESFFPDFVRQMENGVAGAKLTRWKQTQASNILDSPLFLTLDLEKFPRKNWFEMIVRKFTNYRNQIYLKSEGSQQSSTPVAQLKKSNPLLKFSSLMTGRELFAFDNYERLLGAAKQHALDTNSKSPAGAYQTVLKEHWDALSVGDQAHWNQLAEVQGGDVGRNQKEFPINLTLALRDLCQGKLFGNAEMVLFYAFREPNGGDLLAGTIQAHSVHNNLHFGGTPEELELHYGKPWAKFAEDAIPRPLILNPSIPRNHNNQPVFPSIVMDTMPVADIRLLLCDYLEQCWVHQNPTGDVPWEAITSDPAKYYNVEAAYFSIKLDHPQNLSTIQVLTLVEGLLSTSIITSPTPFHFEPEKVLAPDTPVPGPEESPAPPQSPSPQVPTSHPPPTTPVQSTPVVKPTAKKAKRKRYRLGVLHASVSSLNNSSEIPGKKTKRSKEQDEVRPQRKSTRAQKSMNEGPSKNQPGKKKKGWLGYALVDEDGNEVPGTESD